MFMSFERERERYRERERERGNAALKRVAAPAELRRRRGERKRGEESLLSFATGAENSRERKKSGGWRAELGFRHACEGVKCNQWGI